ncbi:hypothetical protein GCM10009837_09700 [Streptomyces durmitorensis]|uniref:DUF4232 domain-containing protein n=1 Tax=Streptomyces durmitorensis TaxID=319947 RepID=A0ABY4PKF4_9ACTN|nr:DUF4232 domain-containing protein [Streptomyces durmitorensis]UQT54166.1 DUF4232 domain-containing protein [Streptomyces durmitorensis]
MRTSIRRPAVLAAAAFAALSLTLTACGGDGGVQDEGAASPSTSVGTGTDGDSGKDAAADGGAAKGGAAGDTEGSDASDSAGADASDTTGSDASDSAARTGAKKKPGVKAVACAADDVEISAVKQDGVPTTHITLTATNVSGHACTLLRHPLIAFGDIQTAKDVPAVAKSRPGTPVVLDAGAPAYAAVRINNGGADEKNRAVTSFNVNLFAADGPAEGTKAVTAPHGGIAVDDAVAKTGYWTPELRNGADEF